MRKRTERETERQNHWQEVVGGQRQSGQSVRAYCRRAGIEESAFYWWRRELARRSRQRGDLSPPGCGAVQACQPGRQREDRRGPLPKSAFFRCRWRQAVLFDPQSGAEETGSSTPPRPPASSPVSRKRDKHGRGRIPRQDQARGSRTRSFGGREGGPGRRGKPVELPPERSEQLDWRPSTLFVIVHVRKKYARKQQLPESGLTLAEQNVVVACKPAEAIPGALAGPGLMAQVIVCKGADHLPLHRLEGIFKRQGLRLSRQTMDGWWLQTAEFLRPLYALAVRVVLASHVIHTDDTSVRVRDAWQKRKYTGRFWPYVANGSNSRSRRRRSGSPPSGRSGRGRC